MRTDEEYEYELLQMNDDDDPESNHLVADAILIEIVRGLGYERTANAFEILTKWYS